MVTLQDVAAFRLILVPSSLVNNRNFLSSND